MSYHVTGFIYLSASFLLPAPLIFNVLHGAFPCRNAAPLPSCSEWDTCATHVIVEEAGGFVLRCDGSGEQGMAGVSLLVQGAARSSTAAAAVSVAAESRPGDLHLSYNKIQLSSPHCVFLGNCSAKSTTQGMGT